MQNILKNTMNKTEFMKVLDINQESGIINLKLGKRYNFSADVSENLTEWLPLSEINRENLSGTVDIVIPSSTDKNFIRVKYGKN